MAFLRAVSLQTKLAGSFLAGVILIGVVSVGTLQVLSDVRQTMIESTESLTAAQSLDRQSRELADLMSYLARVDDPLESDVFKSEMAAIVYSIDQETESLLDKEIVDPYLVSTLSERVAQSIGNVEEIIHLHSLAVAPAFAATAADLAVQEKAQLIELQSAREDLVMVTHQMSDDAEAQFRQAILTAARTEFLALAALLVAFGVALVIGLVAARLVAQPIKQMTATAQLIAKGDPLLRVKVNTRDEIGELGKAFNHMTDKLQQSQAGLEGKVQQRTRELEAAKTDLEEKVAELEQFQKVTTGRELKMIELKKEIEELKQEIVKLKANKD